MTESYVCTCKTSRSADPFVIAVEASSFEEAEKLARACLKDESFGKVIKNSFFTITLNELLSRGIKKYIPNTLEYVYTDLNEML